MTKRRLWVAGLAFMLVIPAVAADHRNLDAGVPLSVDDAYPIKFREPTLQAFAPYRKFRRGPHEGGVFGEFEYGIARDFQFNIGTRVFGRSQGRNEGSGDVDLGVLYNFNTETMRTPAFALKAEAELPTGVHSQGTDFNLKAIMTKSAGFNRVHLNLGHTFVTSPRLDERRHRWQGIAGWDRPIALQTLLVADMVIGESERRGGQVVSLVEIGIRHQLTPRVVASGSMGFGLSGEADRQQFFIGFGISRSF